jgi:hypothetical protein
MKRSTLSKEQRDFARSPIHLPLEFTTRDSWDTMPGIARDISLGGMFIECDQARLVRKEWDAMIS